MVSPPVVMTFTCHADIKAMFSQTRSLHVHLDESYLVQDESECKPGGQTDVMVLGLQCALNAYRASVNV